MAPQRYRSLGQLQQFQGGDLEDPAVLQRLKQQRSWRREIIMLASNVGGTLLTANAVLNLHRIGALTGRGGGNM